MSGHVPVEAYRSRIEFRFGLGVHAAEAKYVISRVLAAKPALASPK